MPNRDQFTTDIYVNGDQARDALAKLETELDKLRKQYANLNKSSKNYETRERELAKQIQSTERSIATAEKGTESYSRAMNNLSKRSIDTLIRLQRQLNSEIKKLDPNTAEFKKLSENYQRVTDRIKDLQNAQRGISQGGFVKRTADFLSKYYGAIRIGYASIKRLVSGFMEAYKTISNFEQANANLASILGANKTQMEELEKAAIQLGSSTRYTSSQVTSLQTELAKLGFTTQQIVDMAPAVLNFAGSVGTDLASAAALAGVALRSFNLRTDQTEDALGTMAVACNKSALSFTYLQNSFSTIAPVAKTYGLSLKDTIALLGTLANAGFDASSAATATRNILLNLSNTNGKLAKALGGSVHSFEDIMDAMVKLRNEGVDLNDTLKLTDKRSVAAFNAFLDGAESARALREELEDVNGELQRIADERADTVEGSIDKMKSAWEGFVLSFRNSKGWIKEVIDFFGEGIQGLRRLIDPEGTTVAEYTEIYADSFRRFRNEFNSVFDQRELMEQRYQQMKQSFAENDTKLNRQKAQALENAYKKVMDETAKEAETIEKRILAVNAEYAAKREKILSKGVDVTDGKVWDKINAELAANNQAWNKALENARKYTEEEVEAVVQGNEQKKELDEKELARLQREYSKKKAQLDAYNNYEEKKLKVQWLKGEIGEAEYNQKLMEGKADYYEKALALAKKYGQDETAITNKMFDDYIKRLETEKKKLKEITDALEKVNKARRQKEEKKERDALTAEAKSRQREQEILEQNLADAKQLINESNWKEEYEFEKFKLQQLYDLKMMSESDLQKALLNLKLQYAQKAAEQVNSIAEKASDFVSALKEAESAKMEVEYQKQLSDASDNADQREQIEAEYEQKKLDLNKKYADADMAVNIAKTIANGAVAAIKAWAELGPIAGGIMAAVVATTTAAEIATIVAQRNAIKNTTLGGSVNSVTTTIPIGERVVTGSSPGYAGGGYTGKAVADSVPMGVVHANEWVAPAWMVRANPVTFANLEQYRKEGSVPSTAPKTVGFADGGFTTSVTKTISESVSKKEILEAIKEGAKAGVKEGLYGEYLKAVVVRRDIEELDAQDARFRKQTSRKTKQS